MKKIIIYQDEGTSPLSVKALLLALEAASQTHPIYLADRHFFESPLLQTKVHLLIFPGGRDIPYHNALQGLPNQHISDFVHEGGNFLGICAGGYYGSAYIEFEKGGPLEVIAERELKFFPGIARGPIYGLGAFRYQSNSGARIARLDLTSPFSSSSTGAAYYNGGCGFMQAEEYENTTVLARYADIESNPAAIVQCSLGKGQAVLCGVHPEYSTSHSYAKRLLDDSQLETLKESESLFTALLKQLGVSETRHPLRNKRIEKRLSSICGSCC